MTQDGVADSNGASISVANVVSSAAVATDAAAATVTVTKSEGNVGEGKLSIVTEGEEGDIDVGGESTGEGKGGWRWTTSFAIVFASTLRIVREVGVWLHGQLPLLPPPLTLTPGACIASMVAFAAMIPGCLISPLSSYNSE